MIYLLDTHVFLWAIIDETKLSENAFSLIENNQNTILISAVSLWEISLKFALGKLKLVGLEPNELMDQGKALGFEFTPLLPEYPVSNYKLEGTWHKDPFDRMLIWQAIQQNITLISKDQNIAKYQSSGLKIIW